MSAARLRGRALDERLRDLGYRVPLRYHRTRLVEYPNGSFASALIRCSDPGCRMCNPPRLLTR